MTALYIHIPWCIKKCPYCDFNSHQKRSELPESAYIEALLDDFRTDLVDLEQPEISSIFIGGGTPSLFSADSYQQLFSGLKDLVDFSPHLEITLEANPGTVEQARFDGYRTVGINRLSLGIQSFDPASLKLLGRIHDGQEALRAVTVARLAGFDNINLDLMYGTPHQTNEKAKQDLEIALSLNPEHLSWYQFTLEPNTYFYKHPPALPTEDAIADIEDMGIGLLEDQGLKRYEISAFALDGRRCQHNLTYWTFGDYFGIGAGAHAKIGQKRYEKHRQPQDYLDPNKPYVASTQILSKSDLIFEFMLNVSRLQRPIPFSLFSERTGLLSKELFPILNEAASRGLIVLSKDHWQVTAFGRRYTNDLQILAMVS